MIKITKVPTSLIMLSFVAVVLVLCAQCIWLAPQSGHLLPQLAALFYFIGPEIFLVLAGYVFGKQLYQLFISENFSRKTVQYFLKEMAVQILPVYYVALSLHYLMAFLSGFPIEHVWKYVVLLQNFATPMPFLFPESWIVPIIMFACLLMPLVLLLFHTVLKRPNKPFIFGCLLLGLILLSVGAKCVYALYAANTDINQWSLTLKPLVVYRLDAVMIGALYGWVEINHAVFILKFRPLFALLGTAGLLFIFIGVGYFQLLIEHHPFFWNVFYLPFTSLSIALLLPIFFPGEMFSFGTKWFAIYLIHFGIAMGVLRYYFPIIPTGRLPVLVFLLAYVLLCVAVGWIVFKSALGFTLLFRKGFKNS